MKNLWVVIASPPPIIMFTFSAFAIGAHLATPSTPPPSLSVYVTALPSLTFLLLMLLPIIRPASTTAGRRSCRPGCSLPNQQSVND